MNKDTMERKRKAKISLSKPKKRKLNDTEPKAEDNKIETVIVNEKTVIPASDDKESLDLPDKYPILKDEELVKKFMSVTMTNNQKGRIRQTVKAYVTGTSYDVIPQVLHDKMQEILQTQQPLNESSLRKIRILYNMLKTVVDKKTNDNTDKEKKKKKNKKSKKNKDENVDNSIENTQTIEAGSGTVKDDSIMKNNVKDNKVKGPKRYVVFVGNLPIDITEDKLKAHFGNVSQHIQDIRIPVRAENKKSCIAYVELKNESAYEMVSSNADRSSNLCGSSTIKNGTNIDVQKNYLSVKPLKRKICELSSRDEKEKKRKLLALSKHHSMLGSKRVNVLYTAQKNGKISKTEAKSKAAKLVALQKAGKLLGSVPLNKKRSHRRALMKAARAKENDSLLNK